MYSKPPNTPGRQRNRRALLHVSHEFSIPPRHLSSSGATNNPPTLRRGPSRHATRTSYSLPNHGTMASKFPCSKRISSLDVKPIVLARSAEGTSIVRFDNPVFEHSSQWPQKTHKNANRIVVMPYGNQESSTPDYNPPIDAHYALNRPRPRGFVFIDTPISNHPPGRARCPKGDENHPTIGRKNRYETSPSRRRNLRETTKIPTIWSKDCHRQSFRVRLPV